MPQFSQYSKNNLASTDPMLQHLFEFVIQYYDCSVIAGHRGEDDQNAAWNAGNSQLQWPDSKHNKLPSHAVDVVPHPLDWEDIDEFKRLGELVKVVAWGLGIHNLEWGGSWSRFRDYPHYQLNIVDD